MNQHLFMVTSDTEFWDKEAVDKVGTRLTENGNEESKSRMFKQMKMRAAALGINEEDADALMKQGIRNTLRNRSMTVAGTKIFGLAGSVAGNISSSPISAPLAANPKTAFLALPGLLDAVLMPTGWAAALGPGAIYGKTVLKRQKKARLAETDHHADAVNVSLSNTSASPDVNATYTGATHKLKIGGKAIIQIGGKEKPALTPMHISGRKQFTGTHTRVFQGMGKELASLVTGPVQYALWQGPQDAWKDLVAHNDPKQAARLQAGPPSPAFINTAPEYMDRRSARTASNPPSPPRYAHVQTPHQYYAPPVTPQSTPYAHAWTSTSVQDWSQYVARAQYHGNFGAH